MENVFVLTLTFAKSGSNTYMFKDRKEAMKTAQEFAKNHTSLADGYRAELREFNLATVEKGFIVPVDNNTIRYCEECKEFIQVRS